MTPAPTRESQTFVQQLPKAGGKNSLNVKAGISFGIPGARMRAGSGARGFGRPGAGA